MIDLPHLALTVHQPWATCLIHYSKRTENRAWIPSPKQLKVGDRFWIHASKQSQLRRRRPTSMRTLRESYGHDPIDTPWTMESQAIIDMLEEIEPTFNYEEELPLGALLGYVTLTGFVTDERNPIQTMQDLWYVGPVGWRVKDPVALPVPIPCSGFQKLWTLSDHLLDQAREQLAA